MNWLALGSIGSLATNVLSNGWNVFSTLKSWQRQDRLQQRIFDREDNAVQRRAADLESAGLSPVLAAGSSASAGSPVYSDSKSQMMDFNALGAVLDAKIGAERVKQEREATKQAQYASRIAQREEARDRMAYYYSLGFSPVDFSWGGSENGEDVIYYPTDLGWNRNIENSPFIRALRAQYDNINYQSDLLRKENAWYNTQRVLDNVYGGLGVITNGANAFGNVYKNLRTPFGLNTRDFYSRSRNYR